jgi:hypothetical protein
MAKPTKPKALKNSAASKAPVVDLAYERKQMLAQMAVQIVPTVMEDPGPGVDSPDAIAQVCVDIAEAILQKAGL